MIPGDVESALLALVEDLSKKRFSKLETDGRAGRLTARELERALTDYGRTLVPLPEDGLSCIDIYPLDGETNAWAIDISLWTEEEGRSDLTLSVTARSTGGTARVEIDDLHVL